MSSRGNRGIEESRGGLSVSYTHLIKSIVVSGFEADDVIGTLAKRGEKEGFQVYMITPDKDYAQLVSERVFMYKPGRAGNKSEVWGIPEVLDHFGICLLYTSKGPLCGVRGLNVIE